MQGGTFGSYKMQLIPESKMFKELSSETASEIVETLNSIKNGTNSAYNSMDQYLTYLSSNGKSYIKDYVKANQNQVYITEDVIQASKDARAAQIAQNEAVKEGTLSFKAGQVALKGLALAGNMIVGILAGFIISKAIERFDNYVHRVENAKNALDEFNSSVKEQQKDISSQESWISENGKQFEELSKGVDKYGHNISLTSDEFSEYKNLTSQIAEMFPTMVTGWNEQGGAILKNKGSIEELTKAYQENQDAYYANIRSKSKKTFDDYKTETKGDVEKKNTIEELMNGKFHHYSYEDWDSFALNEEKGTSETDRILRKVLGQDIYLKLQDEVYQKYGAFDKNKEEKTFQDLSPELQQKIKDIYSKLNNTIDTESEKVRPILQAYLQGDTSGYDELDAEAQTAVQSFIQNVDNSFFENFKTDNDMETWIRQNVIEPLKNGVNSDDLAVKIQTLFSLDQKDYKSYQDYVNAVLAIINSLSKMKDKNGNVIYNDKQINTMKTQFGVGDVDSDGNVSGNKYVSSAQDKFKNVKGAKDYIAGLNKEELDTVMQYNLEPNKDTSVKDLQNFIKNKLQPETKKPENKVTFSSAFNDDDFKKPRKELLKLASSGELTPNTLSSTKEYKVLLTQTGLSAKEAANEIYGMVDASTKLSGFASSMGSLDNAYAEFKTNGFNTMDTLSGLENAFGNLNYYKKFLNIVGDAKSSTKDIQVAYNKLVEEYVNSVGILDNVNESNKGLIQTQLEQLGITNSEEIVTKVLNGEIVSLSTAKSILTEHGYDLISVTSGELKSLVKEGAISNETAKQIAGFALKKKIANGVSINTDGDIANLVALAGVSSKVIDMMEALATMKMKIKQGIGEAGTESGKKYLKEHAKKLKKEIQKEIGKGTKVNYNIDYSGGDSTKSAVDKANKKAKATYQKFSQTIDWCAQTLKKLSAQIDNVQAKLNNTSALSKQISYYKKLVKSQNELAQSYEKTENKYNKVYKNALKKLSKSDQKKVKNGSYTIEHFKGKAKSGKKSGAEKRYNNIQKALTARDNYWEASTSSENEKQKLAEYMQSLASLRWENATTKVEKLNNQISILDTRMSNVSGYVTKNKVLNEQLNLQKKIVDKQQEAYEANQKDADTYYKKISSKYKKNKNSDGTIKVTGVTNKTQLSYIKTFNAYLKQQKTNLVELKQAQEDYTTSLIEARQTASENIKSDYDNKLSLIEARRTALENKASLAEAKGQIVSSSYYDLLTNNSNQRLNELDAEKDKLETQMESVRKYSDLWYTLQANIISVDQSIADESKNAVDNINKQAEALKNLADAKNDYLNSTYDTLDWINGFADEDDYYDDDGNYTDKGYAVMHNKLAQIEIKKQESENYEKSISDLDKLYYSKNSKLSEAEWLKQRNELNKSYQQTQTDIYNQEKELADIRNKQLEQQSDKLKDIIDLKKKSLDADKSEYDYQKSVAEKTKNIADLQKQLAMLEGNNSEDAMAERQKLQKELSDAQDDLKDTQYDKYLDRLEDAFSDLEDRFDKLIEEMKKEDVSTTTENIRTDVEDNNSSRAESGNKEILGENGLQVFDKTANSLITAGTNIETKVDDVNTKLDKILEATIKDDTKRDGNGDGTQKNSISLTDALGEYSKKNKSQDTKGKSSLNKYLASQGYEMSSYTGMAKLTTAILQSKYSDGMNKDDYVKLSEITSKDNFDGSKDANASENKRILEKSLKYVRAKELIDTSAVPHNKDKKNYGKVNQYIWDKTNGKVLSVANMKKLAGILNVSYDSEKIYKALKNAGYSQGGIVGKAIRVNGDDGIATLKTGEAVLTPAQTDALVALRKNLVPLNNFMSAIKTNVPNIQRATTATTSIGDVSFEFNLPNVVDSETLIKTIQTDTRVQKTLQNATVCQLNGSSKFKVNRL